MSKHKEIYFENDIVDHLTSHGWVQGTNAGYDRELALYPKDVEAWLSQTQPLEWAKVDRDEALKRLAQTLDKDGPLEVLRNGFKHLNARFQMCEFKPVSSKNPQTLARYDKVSCRVVRQLSYSLHNGNSIDLVFFVNGIPIATAEVKTDFTQTVEDAIEQYQKDRLPKEPVTKAEEPLLAFKRRALVHFAVSNSEVWMTTQLQGNQTRFLPFNQGTAEGGAGNPLNPQGHQTAYLWERVLERQSWLDILGRFVHLQREESEKDGKKIVKESLIFPRYHQWEAVNKIVGAAQTEGAGQTYLIQHSAGSGKSNSIAWIAHRLASLHDAYDAPVFNSVIVVTDRNVLDRQLQDTIYQFEHKEGFIVRIGDGEAKTQQLIKALLDNTPVIILTLQTFPFFLEYVKSFEGKTDAELQVYFADKSNKQQLSSGDVQKLVNLSQARFAVIADEAHSSQTGDIAGKLSVSLGGESSDGKSFEDLLKDVSHARAVHPNISFFAFTATPKAETIQRFGRRPDLTKPPSESNLPEAFHVYSMKQAIEEGFILDVLKNYTSYKMAFQLAHNGSSYDSEKVDEGDAIKKLFRWVELHPTAISQKVNIIVEHFRSNVAPLLGGKAKAMVVTAGRKDAVRYKLAMDKYIAENGYGLGTLVAFSGDVEDPDSGPDSFSESNMNPALRGRELRVAFGEDEFHLLIVANKFQTGFDQPLLCAMYVDKELGGINAVQTLSRLNRTYPNKDRVYILDFQNDPVKILAAFEPYYKTAELSNTTDPNLIHDLQSKLDAERIYTASEVDAFANAFFAKGSKQKDFAPWIKPAAQRFHARWKAAEAELEKGDKQKGKVEMDALQLFRKDLGSFVGAYDFLGQIFDYGDTDLEKRSIFFRHLNPLLRIDNMKDEIDLSLVDMTHFKLEKLGENALVLGGDSPVALNPMVAVGSGSVHEKELTWLAQIVSLINKQFEGAFSSSEIESFVHLIWGNLVLDPDLKSQAKANTKEKFYSVGSFRTALTKAIVEGLRKHASMAQQIFADPEKQAAFEKITLDYVYDALQDKDAPHLNDFRAMVKLMKLDVGQVPTYEVSEEVELKRAFWLFGTGTINFDDLSELTGQDLDALEVQLGKNKLPKDMGLLDVLGTYDSANYRVTLYDKLIQFVANKKAWDVEKLRHKVYLHELAHAASHLGLDGEAKEWPAFAHATRDAKEYFAQIYAYQMLVQEGDTQSIVLMKELSETQPPCYSTYLKDIELPLDRIHEKLLESRQEAVRAFPDYEAAFTDSWKIEMDGITEESSQPYTLSIMRIGQKPEKEGRIKTGSKYVVSCDEALQDYHDGAGGFFHIPVALPKQAAYEVFNLVRDRVNTHVAPVSSLLKVQYQGKQVEVASPKDFVEQLCSILQKVDRDFADSFLRTHRKMS